MHHATLRRAPRAASLLSSLLLLGALVGCSDDAPPATAPGPDAGQDMLTMQDMTASSDATPDVDQALPEEMGSNPEPDAGEVEMGALDASPDMFVGDMEQDAAEDASPDMVEALDMPEDMLVFPPDQDVFPCAYPATDPMCFMGAQGPGSFITEFVIAEDATCCRDFDGDGTNENFIGATLISNARTLAGIDVNGNIAAAIQSGELVFLFEFEDWQNDRFDAQLTTRMLTGVDTAAPFQDNMTGTGAFFIGPESYDPQTDAPVWPFAQSRVFDGELLATGGRLRVYFPGIVDAIEIILVDVQVKATVVPGANLAAQGGVELVDGELSGAVLRDEFFNSLNTFARSCTCINQDIFTRQTNGRYTCALRESRCVNSPNQACELTGRQDLCATLALFSGSVDVDTTGDGRADAFGFGARFKAVPTQLFPPQ